MFKLQKPKKIFIYIYIYLAHGCEWDRKKETVNTDSVETEEVNQNQR